MTTFASEIHLKPLLFMNYSDTLSSQSESPRQSQGAQAASPSCLSFVSSLHKLVWGTESWEVSAVPGNESVISNGPLEGQTLSYAVSQWGEQLLGRKGMAQGDGSFPLLTKIIDAKDDLSIQVHPNEDLAQKRHHCHGKTEMWVVLDAEPGASLLAGFSKPLPPEEYAARVADGTIVNYLARHEVHPGDVFFIPAGRVHAICGGVRLCEIQQSSDITYRLYDYHRLGLDGKPRQLHVEEALDAIDFSVLPDYNTHYERALNQPVPIVQCPYFTVNLVEATEPVSRQLKDRDSFVLLSVLEGEAVVTPASASNGAEAESFPLRTSLLIPATQADFTITPTGSAPVRLLETYL